MKKRTRDNYAEVAREVLDELGGGPITSGDLVRAAQERGLIGTDMWVYHSFLRKVRGAPEFDTSQHGRISLVKQGAPEDSECLSTVAAVAEVPQTVPEEEAESPEAEGSSLATVG